MPSPIGQRRRRYFYAAGMLLLSAVIAWAYGTDGGPALEPPPASAASPAPEGASPRQLQLVRPDIETGKRVTQQPGSIHAFESVDLYAMVAGYLKIQNVDIGSRIKKGETLAVIDVPREESLLAEAAALSQQAKAQALQAESKVKTAEADRQAADATAAQYESDIDRLVANKKLAEAQYARVKALVDERAVDVRLRDEQKRDLEAAVAAERTARLQAQTARAELSAAASRVEQAEADVVAARAAVAVAEARLEKARVDVRYATITAPFDGVVTRRNYFPGAFIGARTASEPPLLTVERTDLMRVVVQVPDRDVVLTNVGDPARLTVDGLEGREFRGTVSRTAEHEDPTMRTMRVEIDIRNPEDGLLRDGMYGRATIELDPAVKRLILPLDCILDRSPKGAGAVFIVRGRTVERLPVELGTTDGKRIEIKSGITADDEVVRAPDPSLKPGTRVDHR